LYLLRGEEAVRPVSVVIRHLAKSYDTRGGRVVALRDVDLAVEPGELMVLAGPNGSGKTTLLRLVAGVDRPDSGQILLSERTVSDPGRNIHVDPAARDLSLVPQSYTLYPHRSVAENIAFPLLLRKLPSAEIRRRVQEAAEMLEIDDLLGRMPRELSAGQRQRTAVAKAIARRPSLLLMDEPLSNIDEQLRSETRLRLKLLQRAMAITIIYVTHEQRELMMVGDRMALLHDGVVEQSGTPRELYEDPQNAYVAGFLGSDPINLLEGRLVERDGGPWFRANGLECPVPAHAVPLLRGGDGQALRLGVRPEDVSLGPGGRGWADGRVALVRSTGPDYLISVTLDGGQQLLAKAQQAPERSGLDGRCAVSFDPGRSLVFDARGRRLGRRGAA
jgi:multiple sugar transport system ATP-binding protein